MRLLKLFWKKWLPVSQKIGNFQARVILSAFYFILFLPLALIFKILSDPLQKKPTSTWKDWEHKVDSLEEARKQY